MAAQQPSPVADIESGAPGSAGPEPKPSRAGRDLPAAIAVGVDPKTIGRWRDGVDRPPVETQELVARWIADRRAELAVKKPSVQDDHRAKV